MSTLEGPFEILEWLQTHGIDAIWTNSYFVIYGVEFDQFDVLEMLESIGVSAVWNITSTNQHLIVESKVGNNVSGASLETLFSE
jgi:hypothetical protein